MRQLLSDYIKLLRLVLCIQQIKFYQLVLGSVFRCQKWISSRISDNKQYINSVVNILIYLQKIHNSKKGRNKIITQNINVYQIINTPFQTYLSVVYHNLNHTLVSTYIVQNRKPRDKKTRLQYQEDKSTYCINLELLNLSYINIQICKDRSKIDLQYTYYFRYRFQRQAEQFSKAIQHKQCYQYTGQNFGSCNNCKNYL
eukprot:TRINITY_DN204_c0_g1_i18.p1 TRINITY_DN204_c0_g1~~TRINITY_DN204_c0_g1_i18.p1  ORF type:complete len:199 (+),score=-25.15 TRINITY_DN204_c0_g1_i18:520-1116(+)